MGLRAVRNYYSQYNLSQFIHLKKVFLFVKLSIWKWSLSCLGFWHLNHGHLLKLPSSTAEFHKVDLEEPKLSNLSERMRDVKDLL